MASYLARYQQGEHEAVWRDLVALGERVREQPYLDDARAVARETMRRVRHDLELLVPRLREIGYDFAMPDEVLLPPEPRALAALAAIEREVGPVPLSLRAFHEIVGSVNLMGAHPVLSSFTPPPDFGHLVRSMQETLGAHTREPAPPPAADPFAKLRELPGAANLLGSLPAAALELMRQALQVNQQLTARLLEIPHETERMMQTGVPSPRLAETQAIAESLQMRMRGPDHAPTIAGGPASDPLVVGPMPFDDPEDYRVYDDEEDGDVDDAPPSGGTRRYAIDVAPDDCHKAGMSGGGPYHVLVPNAGADAELVDSRYGTFVGYLRESLRWGGFPGLAEVRERPAELARLTEGLLPI